MKQWVVRKEVSKNLPEQILFYRGIKTTEEAEKFLNPDYEEELHDPFKILNMDKAVSRILQAIKKNEAIIIFGDYDADGVCSSVIFHDFFKKIGFENFYVHIPDRNLDGYGLTFEAIDKFIKRKAGLIITLDCGITDFAEVERANSAGLDVVIIDHHLANAKLPDAAAVVDAKQKDDPYPFKSLCGAGVAFKTVQAMIFNGDFNIVPGWEKWLLDLVAIATVADMVPLVGENRALVYYGLQVLRKTRRAGLLSFLRRLDINLSGVNEDDIGFMIAPRINIASRMEHANTSFALLTTESSEESDWIGGHLEVMNNDRKRIVENILRKANKRIEKSGEMPKVIVEGDMGWHPGVLGIAANRMVEKYGIPVFLWGEANAKKIRGSCRSDGTVNLVELMKVLPKGVLTEYGGHAMAGGFGVKEEKIADFKDEIVKAYEKVPKQKIENGILNIDKELKIGDVDWKTWALIEKLQPFGMENPKPVFLFSGLEIFNVKKFGNGGIHLGLDFKKSDNKIVSAIGFFIANDKKFDLRAGQKIDLVASLEKSTFRNYPELRLRIIDLKVK